MNTSSEQTWKPGGWMLVIAALLVLSGCATPSVQQPQYPSKVQGWNGLDTVEFLQAYRLADYSRLVLEHLDTSKAVLPPTTENTYKPTVAVLNSTDAIVLGELSKKLAGVLTVSSNTSSETPMEKTLLLRGAVMDIHPGSQAARYWAGFGAGSAWVKISGEIVDAKSQAVLLRFEQQRVGAMGLFGGAYEPMLTDCVVGIGRDIGKLLTLAGAQ